MNNETSKTMLALIRSAICGSPLSDEERALYSAEMLSEIVKSAREHDLLHLLSLGLKNNNLLDTGAQQLETEIFKAAYRYEQLKFELARLYDTLEKAEIPYIPLKGAVIRGYYPEAWMRTSCDIDILVDEGSLERAVALLAEELGYSTDNKKSVHDISLYSPGGVHLELHYNIMEDNETLDRVLSRVWDYASPISEGKSRHILTNEFFLFHVVAHLAYHFLFGGCGVRPLIDLYLLREKLEYDKEKLLQLLGEALLADFYANLCALSDAWMLGREHTDVTLKMQEYILDGGVYGSQENRTVIQQQKKGGKFKYFMYRVFLPYDKLKYRYPIIKKHPWLTPFMQVRRWFAIIFGGRLGRSVSELKVNSSVSRSEAEDIRRFLDETGLKNL